MESFNHSLFAPASQATALGFPDEVSVGGVSKAELRKLLDQAAVRLNAYAEQLFEDSRFETCRDPEMLRLEVLSPTALGFAEGARFDHLVQAAAARGLGLCPLELGPHLRLQFLHQEEAPTSACDFKGSAPSGSITVASAEPLGDGLAPWGFYVRRIGNERWLRGYRSGPEHVWAPRDLLVFRRRREGI